MKPTDIVIPSKPTKREISPVPDGLAVEIEKMPLLSALLPYEFGRSVIEELEVVCASCGVTLAPDTIRGKIETMADGHAAHLTAYGLCFSCQTITPIVSRFSDDGTVLVKLNNGWAQDVWSTRRANIFHNLPYFAKAHWGRLLPPALAATVVATYISYKLQLTIGW